MNDSYLSKQDSALAKALSGEVRRQTEGLELIPSENYVSAAVLELSGSVFTNKYSEGYPGKRYYGGQEFTDAVETLAIERAKDLFDAAFANVQPHSGSNANLAVYLGLLEPGDTVLGMDLSHGGHLTHGHPVTKITKIVNFVRYKMKDVDTGEIDYEELRGLAHEHKPKIILAGFSAYPRNLDYEKFVQIAREVGAVTVADVAHIAGLIAGKALPNPFSAGFDIMTTTTHKTLRGPRGGMILVRESEELAAKIDKAVFPGIQGGPLMQQVAAKAACFYEAAQPEFAAYAEQVIKNAQAMAEVFLGGGVRLITGGTDNHLILADVYGSLGVTGKDAQSALDRVGITLNMNMIADDSRSAQDPSGIRFGTPAITSRGFDEQASAEVARLMLEVLRDPKDAETSQRVAARIAELARQHPIPTSYVRSA